MVERETIQKGVELVMAAGLGTIGLWFGNAPAEVMIAVGAGMGASWLLNLTEASVQEGLQRWLGEEGVLNHDIERVLGEALQEAAKEVRQQLPQHHTYHHWNRTAPQKAQRLLGEFERLEKDGRRLIRVWAQDEARRAEMVGLMSNEDAEIGQSIDHQITALLQTQGDPSTSSGSEYAYVLHFLRQELAKRWQEHFVDRLKHDTPAWRACQRLWQGSLSAALGQVGRDVAQMKVVLDKIVAAQEQGKGSADAPGVAARKRDELFMQALLLQLRQELMRELRHIKEDTSQIKGDTSQIKGDTSQIKGDTSEIKAAIVGLLNKVEQLLVTVPELVEGMPPSPTETRSWGILHPYPALPNFTGRWQERVLLSEWLAEDTCHPLLVLRALGGFGKSALTWHWLHHDVDEQQWERVFWWSFYEQDARMENFLRVLFHYIAPNQLVPPNNYELFQALAFLLPQQPTLIILDGFERELRAYGTMGAAYLGDIMPSGDASRSSQGNERDCISPLAEHFLRLVTMPRSQSKVLMTTRLRPRVLERHRHLVAGCREEELTALTPADAVTLFRRQKIKAARHEIEQVGKRVGYHPLSLRLLAGAIMEDWRQPGDIRVAQQLKVSDDLIQNRHHVLEHAENSLSPRRRRLLSTLACFRSPLEVTTLDKLFADEMAERSEDKQRYQQPADLDADLHNLRRRGLVQRHQTQLDLHPIVRRYAYDRLGNQERQTRHTHLRDYFAAVPDVPEKVKKLAELTPLIEFYHHTVQAGQYDAACDLFYDRISKPIYYQFGAYQLRIELLRALFPDGEDKPPRLQKEAAQGWTLTALANSYSLNGQPRQAVPLLEQDIAICEKQDDKENLAIGLGNLANRHRDLGSLRDAEANLRRRIALCREIGDEFNEAIGQQELGRLLAYRGVWQASEEALAASTRYWQKAKHVQGLAVDEAYRALRALLMVRDVVSIDFKKKRFSCTQGHNNSDEPSALRASFSRSSLPNPPKTTEVVTTNENLINTALTAAQQALAFADETANDPRFVYPVRDYVRAYWLLGAARRVKGDWAAADRYLTEALTRCRGINMVDYEADILLEMARLRVAQGNRAEGRRLAEEALIITERSGYVLQGADVHLLLAELALEAGKRDEARDHARQARALATCDGPPDYTYKVAYEEAGRLLGRLEIRD